MTDTMPHDVTRSETLDGAPVRAFLLCGCVAGLVAAVVNDMTISAFLEDT